jgi:SAM-dependent methyltransferase
MTSIDRSRKHEFTGMGELYDRARPPYPPALFKQLHNHFNFRMGETTLEIGCGTGKATEHLAARGLTVTEIDIAPDLLAVADVKLKAGKLGCSNHPSRISGRRTPRLTTLSPRRPFTGSTLPSPLEKRGYS